MYREIKDQCAIVELYDLLSGKAIRHEDDIQDDDDRDLPEEVDISGIVVDDPPAKASKSRVKDKKGEGKVHGETASGRPEGDMPTLDEHQNVSVDGSNTKSSSKSKSNKRKANADTDTQDTGRRQTEDTDRLDEHASASVSGPKSSLIPQSKSKKRKSKANADHEGREVNQNASVNPASTREKTVDQDRRKETHGKPLRTAHEPVEKYQSAKPDANLTRSNEYLAKENPPTSHKFAQRPQAINKKANPAQLNEGASRAQPSHITNKPATISQAPKSFIKDTDSTRLNKDSSRENTRGLTDDVRIKCYTSAAGNNVSSQQANYGESRNSRNSNTKPATHNRIPSNGSPKDMQVDDAQYSGMGSYEDDNSGNSFDVFQQEENEDTASDMDMYASDNAVPAPSTISGRSSNLSMRSNTSNSRFKLV